MRTPGPNPARTNGPVTTAPHQLSPGLEVKRETSLQPGAKNAAKAIRTAVVAERRIDLKMGSDTVTGGT